MKYRVVERPSGFYPEVRYLFGPVSISADLPIAAREQLVAYYDRFFGCRRDGVAANRPFRFLAAPPAFSELDADTAYRVLKANLGALGARHVAAKTHQFAVHLGGAAQVGVAAKHHHGASHPRALGVGSGDGVDEDRVVPQRSEISHRTVDPVADELDPAVAESRLLSHRLAQLRFVLDVDRQTRDVSLG